MRQFVDAVIDNNLLPGHLRGFLHVAIGRRIAAPDGAVISTGLTWRELSALLKESRVDPELVAELGADPETLSPRDRNRFWYAAIALAKPDAPAALLDGEKFAKRVASLGYRVGPSPLPLPPPGPPPAVKPAARKLPPPPPPMGKRKK